MTTDESRQILDKWRNKLLSFPNVNGVGLGQKEGKYCIYVMVSQKISVAQLDTSEIIPSECDGLKTIVLPVGTITAQNNFRK